MLVHRTEEAFVVGLVASGQGIAAPPGALAGGEGVQVVELGLARPEVLVVHVALGTNDQVAENLDADGEEVRADPVERHARRHIDAEHERQGDGEPVGRVLLEAGLLPLERVDAVLSLSHDDCRERGEKRHDPREAAVLGGDESQELGPARSAVRDAVNDLHETEEDEDLDGERDEREQRVVVELLVELVLLLPDGLLVAEVLDLDAVQVGHQADHDDAVPLAPEREGHEHDLDDGGEQQDGHPPASREVVARLHDIREQACEGVEHAGWLLVHFEEVQACLV